MPRKIYKIENLDCANCAAKLEQRLAAIPGVEAVTITFATKQLRLTAQDPDALLPELRRIAVSMEPDVRILDRDEAAAVHADHHDHDAACSCGCHDHDAACGCGHHDHAHCGHSHHGHEDAHAPEKDGGDRRDLIGIIAGSVLFLAGIVLERFGLRLWGIPAELPVLVAAYLILGAEVVLEAAGNITRGQVFDENFLMSLATIGAFAIQEYPEAVGVMLFYRIGEYFEHRAVERSRAQIMDAVDLRPEVVNRVEGEAITAIPAAAARVGDTVLVRPGDRIPLDGTVVAGESRIDTSPITGEPVPVHVGAGDAVTSGCVNTSGQLRILVEKPLAESMVTRILDSVENAAASKPKIDRFITRFARIYTPVVVVLAVGTAVIPSLITGNWSYWVYTALSFLVMSCPCALVLSVPLAFFSGIGVGSRQGILFKGGISIEAMSDIRAVAMDKTGTITEGNFVLQKVVPAEGLDADTLLRLCAGCEQRSTHPIAGSIAAAARERGLALEEPEEMEEIAGCGVQAVIGGRRVLCGNRKLMERARVALDGWQPAGSGTEVLAAVDGRFAGSLVISDTLKKDAGRAVARLKKLGVTTAMLTGDTAESAGAVAAELGIDEVHAKLLPQEKLAALGKLRDRCGQVMFVGDGINDAPVLAGADVGAAMGSGADAAIEAADVVYMTSAMEAIPRSLQIARRTRRVSWQNVIFALAVKICVMILGLCGFASMWMAVFADSGVAMLCVLNSVRLLWQKQ